MQNSVVLITFSASEQKYLFWANVIQKNQNCQFRLNFGTQRNLNMQNSMMMLTSSVFNWKYSFWANLVQTFKIVSLNLNLVPRLIQVCRIQWWCLFFLLQSGNSLCRQICSKKSNCQIKLKFGMQTNSSMENSMVMFLFFFCDQKQTFWVNLVSKFKIDCLK